MVTLPLIQNRNRIVKEHLSIQNLCRKICESSPTKRLKETLSDRSNSVKKISLEGICGSFPAVLTADLMQQTNRSILHIAQDKESAGYFYNDIVSILGAEEAERKAFFFPSRYNRGIKYGSVDSANEVLRTQAIEALSHETSPKIIVSYPDAVAEKIPDTAGADSHLRMEVSVGDTIDRAHLRTVLWNMGMNETDYVYSPGEFAVRGSLIDIFSFAYEYPVRIDFFDDEIESIRTFDCVDQCSIEKIEKAIITPPISNETITHGEAILNLLPQNTILFIENSVQLHNALQELYESKPVHPESNSIKTEKELQELLISPGQFEHLLGEKKTILSGFIPAEERHLWESISFKQNPEPLYHKQFDRLIEEVEKYQKENGYTVYIMSGQESQLQRLTHIFQEKGASTHFSSVTPTLHAGFIDHETRIVLLTDHSIFERFHRYKTKADRIKQNVATLSIKDIQGFSFGDYVVHINHGIGQFAGLLTMEQNGKRQEYVRVNYKGGDSIYVSIHSLHHLSKYKSKESDTPPALSKLGSGAWEKLKETTKKKVKDIARDLIKLYASRMEQKGFAFSPDTYLQEELESSFMYEDTPDQEKTTAEVKHDMEQPVPMDRLVCGDVGFGKTEIAIRAAFKAATDNKQVAVLVPTTVLAYQHYRTFKKRLKNFPVNIAYLSRAKSAKEQRDILTGLKEGKIDIIIGTHKLVGKEVIFKDLGLLIIDEEQKFGVSVKEKLRQLRANVDTLTLTATPIPRTLQFSLMGARDLSNILTPPPNRHPIYTELSTYNGENIAEAINFELARGGQIFFVHNRIHNLNDIASDIVRAVPDIRIGIAHGQMAPKEVEKILMDFVDHRYDLLLATSIVENGIDVPNANTIIINDAHRYGLSDLHQLRGRVGRSDKKAFCHLMVPPKEYLTPEAVRRLEAITSYTDLGSGIHIAMQDLDIRGAGNMLGAEQSGFIADIGYETYKKILEEAVGEIRNEEFGEVKAYSSSSNKEYVKETIIETDFDAYFPDDYVPGDQEKLVLYRKLEDLTDHDSLRIYTEKLLDRFGKLPPEAENLLELILIKWKGKALGLEKIVLKGNRMNMQFVSDEKSPFYRSETFSAILSSPILIKRKMQFKQVGNKRLLIVPTIESIKEASSVLDQLLSQ